MNIEVLDVDGKEYYIVKKINNNGNLYYILVNTMDRNDLIIRKYLKENKENIYSCIGFSYCNYKWSKSNSMSRS